MRSRSNVTFVAVTSSSIARTCSTGTKRNSKSPRLSFIASLVSASQTLTFCISSSVKQNSNDIAGSFVRSPRSSNEPSQPKSAVKSSSLSTTTLGFVPQPFTGSQATLKSSSFPLGAAYRTPLASGASLLSDHEWLDTWEHSPALNSPTTSYHASNSTFPAEVDTYPFYTPSTGFTGEEWFPSVNVSGSRSPASAASSAPQVWHQDGRQRFRTMMSPTGSDLSTPYTPYDIATNGNVFEVDATAIPPFLSFSDQDTFEEETIMRALSSVPHLPRTDKSRVYLGHFEARYLDAFWQNFHPMFSIVHKPTFDAVGTASLVRALMLAIGAQYLEDECAKMVSRTLRETCFKLLSQVCSERELLGDLAHC